MGNANDSKILALKKQIEEKKKQLNKSLKFTPITNCSIEVDGVRFNIQVLNKEQLILLFVKLNSYRMSAKALDLLDDYIISGFKVDDWITDIKSKLEVVSRKDEERKLRDMEEKLNFMLSNEKKIELELDEIENSLK